MNTAADYTHALPASVIARCAEDSCHGQQANGPNELAAASYEESLRVLAYDMAASRSQTEADR